MSQRGMRILLLFFVNGNVVGKAAFGYDPAVDQRPDDVTFAVSYRVLLASDPLCCPSGGVAMVRYQWHGSTLVTLDPLQGEQPTAP
jgi:hypothetical protein